MTERMATSKFLPQPLLEVYEKIAASFNALFDDVHTFRSGAGDPTGSVVPLFLGEEYLNTTGNHWYKAHGLTNADWTALN
jgi:hypothetical protein